MKQEWMDIKEFLDFKFELYNRFEFIEDDPVAIPHQFSRKEDIEISAFLTATISWGQRKTILKNSNKLLSIMDFSPYEFICGADNSAFRKLEEFTHRTFNGSDCVFFIRSLKSIYFNHGGLEKAFDFKLHGDVKTSIIEFRKLFLSTSHHPRSAKHLANPATGSSAKRINMFLRWMVRKDRHGIDFGIWDSINPSQLYCPLDVHTGHVARKLGLISRKQNDWQSLEELMAYLRTFDPDDPVRYDFALFGLGRYEDF